MATIKLLLGVLVGILVLLVCWQVFAVVRTVTYMLLFALCLVGMQVAKQRTFKWLMRKREWGDKVLGCEPTERQAVWVLGTYNTIMVAVMAWGQPYSAAVYLFPLYATTFIVLSLLLVAEVLCVMFLWPSGNWYSVRGTATEGSRTIFHRLVVKQSGASMSQLIRETVANTAATIKANKAATALRVVRVTIVISLIALAL